VAGLNYYCCLVKQASTFDLRHFEDEISPPLFAYLRVTQEVLTQSISKKEKKKGATLLDHDRKEKPCI